MLIYKIRNANSKYNVFFVNFYSLYFTVFDVLCFLNAKIFIIQFFSFGYNKSLYYK